ncbi:MBL fold metallo-hydrolase [Sphingosinicella sp. YJ22]|uniref:MBL fold metallo-hydrolase n=1 Tax=Sphingosinicella sp. YJ22 TaxID=1104780 RepID=UPI00140A5201|nr:MBL fold metallo-hydrolase [Sphingosinicella sp. YJ22]
MIAPTVTIHGAAQTVTGSCFELALGKRNLLVDCGLFQGSRTLERLNREPFAFAAGRLDAVVLTHAHLDHSGLLPRLAAEGFAGTIWCTGATADLLEVMLADAAHIQEQEARRRNRRADRADLPPVRPLYTSEDAERAVALIRTASYEEQFEPAPGFQGRFWNAGHILGSASAEVFAGGSRLLFSGDLGPQHKAFHADPVGPHGVDHLFCESTYGDRDRDDASPDKRRALLETEVKEALRQGGNLVIPAFALERTQELLLDLSVLIDSGRLRSTPIFIDSPLASRATEVFARHQASLEDLGSGDMFGHPAFHFIDSVDASMRLNHVSGAIIIAASGMCEAGRIRHHLRHNLPRGDSTILFVGFQAQGSLGRTILEGAKRVRLSGRDVAVRARINKLDVYSAHADREELVAWMKARRPVRGSVFLTHGEPQGLEGLRSAVEQDFASVILPEIGERYELPAGAVARRLTTGRMDLREAVGRDWQNDYADFAVNLKQRLEHVEPAERREAIAQLRGVLERFSAHRDARKAARAAPSARPAAAGRPASA